MQERFRKSISEMEKLRKKGLINEIIFVTWRGRMEGRDSLKKYLSNKDVRLITSKESKFGGRNSIWHQMKALDIALRNIPSGYHVLKTRTDVYIEKDFLERLFSGGIEHLQNSADSGVFENRMWVPSFEIQTPFYFCDYCFWGLRKDIDKLVNYDARYDALYELSSAIAETRRFIHPYLKEFQFLEHYLLNYIGPNRDHILFENRKKLMKRRLNSEVFSQYLSFYYKCALTDFYIDYSPVSFKDKRLFTENHDMCRVSEANYFDSFIENFLQEPYKSRHTIMCTKTSWIKSQFDGEKNSDVPREVLNGFQRSFSDWTNYKIDQVKMQSELKQEKRYFFDDPKDTETVGSRLRTFVAERILKPVGLHGIALRAYKKIMGL